MELKIKFSNTEARNLEWLLRLQYKSRKSLAVLAKQAIRDKAAEMARQIVENGGEVKENGGQD